MKILHLIIDHQVIERTLGVYEKVFPGCNEVIIFDQGLPLKHINKYSSCVRVDRETVKKIGESFDFHFYDYIVAHYLTFEMIDFIMYAPNTINVCWEIYGYDLYNQFLEPLGYKVQQTNNLKFLSSKARVLKFLKLYGLYMYIRTSNKSYLSFVRNRYFRKITSRINSIAVCCSGDARVLEEYTRRKYNVYKAFNYSLHETLGDLFDAPFNQSNGVLVGNSASLSNNHLYVLEILKHLGVSNSPIIIPLSYGGVDSYKKTVISEYTKCFPSTIEILLDYLPLHEYNRFFLKIGIMVLASWRQESIGTIFMGLYLGIKIYMSNKSPLYQSLIDEGFIIYPLEESNSKSFSIPLLYEQQEHNRSLLLKCYNDDAFEQELKRQYA